MNELIFQAPLQDTAQAKTNYAVQSGILEYNDSSLDDIAAIVLVVFLFNGFNVRKRKNKVQANPTNLLLLLILILLRYSNYNRTLYKNSLSYPSLNYYNATPVITEKIKDTNPYLGGYEIGYSDLRSNNYTGGCSHSPCVPYSGECLNETIDNSSESFCFEKYIFADAEETNILCDSPSFTHTEGSAEDFIVFQNINTIDIIDSTKNINSIENINNTKDISNTETINNTEKLTLQVNLTSTPEDHIDNEPVEGEIINESSNQLSLMIKDDYFGSKVTVLLPNSSVITGEVVFKFKDILSVKSEGRTIFISEKDIISFF
jgi:hypothetical protein